MYFDGKPVLQIVAEVTRFFADRFLMKISTESVWETIVLCSSSVYTGLSDYILSMRLIDSGKN